MYKKLAWKRSVEFVFAENYAKEFPACNFTPYPEVATTQEQKEPKIYFALINLTSNMLRDSVLVLHFVYSVILWCQWKIRFEVASFSDFLS